MAREAAAAVVRVVTQLLGRVQSFGIEGEVGALVVFPIQTQTFPGAKGVLTGALLGEQDGDEHECVQDVTAIELDVVPTVLLEGEDVQ